MSLVEVLMVVTLSALIALGAWSVLSAQLRVAGSVADSADRLEVARVGRHLLAEELRAGWPGRDWGPPEGDSLPLRAFRGVALPCGPGRPGHVHRVQYRGIRWPDPAKDSLLLLGADGLWRVRALEAIAVEGDGDAPCRGGDPLWRVERWTVEKPVSEIVLARLFERGSYHLADGALRYRRGGGGRQPLTPELLDDGRSALEGHGTGGGVRLRLTFRGCRDVVCGIPWRAVLRPGPP